MKSALLILLLFTCARCYGSKCTDGCFIEFIHIGTEEKPILPLIVSFKMVDVPLTRDEKEILKLGFKADTVGIKEKKLFQRYVLTDRNSYIKTKLFIKEHLKYFTRSAPHDYSYGVFKVVFEDRLLYLNSSNSNILFKCLSSFLKKNKCDKKLINAFVETYPIGVSSTGASMQRRRVARASHDKIVRHEYPNPFVTVVGVVTNDIAVLKCETINQRTGCWRQLQQGPQITTLKFLLSPHAELVSAPNHTGQICISAMQVRC